MNLSQIKGLFVENTNDLITKHYTPGFIYCEGDSSFYTADTISGGTIPEGAVASTVAANLYWVPITMGSGGTATPYTRSAAYSEGDLTDFSGMTFRANGDIASAPASPTLGTTGATWTPHYLVGNSSWKGNWTINTAYAINDLVSSTTLPGTIYRRMGAGMTSSESTFIDAMNNDGGWVPEVVFSSNRQLGHHIFNANNDGYVPMTGGAEDGSYLKQDATWGEIPADLLEEDGTATGLLNYPVLPTGNSNSLEVLCRARADSRYVSKPTVGVTSHAAAANQTATVRGVNVSLYTKPANTIGLMARIRWANFGYSTAIFAPSGVSTTCTLPTDMFDTGGSNLFAAEVSIGGTNAAPTVTINHIGFKNMSTGAWTERNTNTAYYLLEMYWLFQE